ncbi:MAG: head-tail connector protein [Mycobacterium sp.]
MAGAGWSQWVEELEPPTFEPVTLDLARRHCRIDQDYDDDLLELYMAGARLKCEKYLDRALVARKMQYNITWSPPPTATPLVPQSLIVFPLNWPPLVKRPVELPMAPLISVEEIRWGEVGDLKVADPDDYTVNNLVVPGYVAVKPQLLPRIPQQSMSIDYTGGWMKDADDSHRVPATIRIAILMTTAWIYEGRGDVATEEIPTAALSLLNPYRLWSFAG